MERKAVSQCSLKEEMKPRKKGRKLRNEGRMEVVNLFSSLTGFNNQIKWNIILHR